MPTTPSRVQSSAGSAITTGSTTVSLTGCTAGNVIVMHTACRGVTDDFTFTNVTNIDNCAGSSPGSDNVVSGSGISPGILHRIDLGRCHSNGTVSYDMTCGASGEDLFGQIHEFTNCSTSTTAIGAGGVFENGSQAGGRDVIAGHGTNVTFGGSPIITNGTNRLGITLTAVSANLAMTDFTGETNADLTEATEFQSATGATCTLQLQTASIATAVTVDSGSQTIGSAQDWVICTFALNPAPDVNVLVKFMTGPLRW